MSYSKEIILTDLINQGIPEAMNKYMNVNMNPNPLTKNFSEWSKNTLPVTAEAIINESMNSSRQGGGSFNYGSKPPVLPNGNYD